MSGANVEQRPERILSFEDARRVVLKHADLLRNLSREREQVQLLDSLGRTLAEDVHADRDLPPFPRAARDGYALHADDVRETPQELAIVGEIRAGGDLPAGFTSLGQGEAVSIMTGAPVPAGADAVVMVEYTVREGNRVRVSRQVRAGENVVPQGSEGAAGTVLATSGTVISPAQIALAAAVGKARVSVYRRPRIGILPTGDEVVAITEAPKSNQIRNSNSFSLAAQVMAAGGEPLELAIAPDNPQRLRELMKQGLESDLLLLSGGVSAGDYDLVEDVLADFSAEFLFTGVQIQPGKPLVFGRLPVPSSAHERWIYFFGLPGNPISTMVTFELFARSMVRALAGASAGPLRGTKARLARAIHVKLGLTRFLPARLGSTWNDAEVELVKWQGSGDIAAFGRADCLLVVPPDREHFDVGEMMTVLPL